MVEASLRLDEPSQVADLWKCAGVACGEAAGLLASTVTGDAMDGVNVAALGRLRQIQASCRDKGVFHRCE